MDKFEYNLKLDQMKSLFAEEKYEEAADIADSINWNKVKNPSALLRAGEIYEKTGRYTESRDILLLAYDRSPIGRGIIFRLAEVAVKMKDFQAAQDYYDEFVEIAPHDNSKYTLRYNIKKGQGAPYSELIPILEELHEQEYTEEWAYELAYLYHKAGMSDKCIEACDELILWFGDGPYVERALELKMLYQPLTKVQEEKYRSFRKTKDGYTRINTEELQRAGEYASQPVDIPKIDMNPGRFDTINMQKDLAQHIQKIRNATEESTITNTLNNINRIAEEIPYLMLPKKDEAEKAVYIETDEEIDVSLRTNFQELLGEDSDGQLSLMMKERAMLERQITGQITIEEVLEEWERTRRAAEAALQEAEQRKLESAKARALQQAGDIMDRLTDVIPKLDAGVTPRELLEEEYLQGRPEAEVRGPEPSTEAEPEENSAAGAASDEPYEEESYMQQPYAEESYMQQPYTGETYVEELPPEGDYMPEEVPPEGYMPEELPWEDNVPENYILPEGYIPEELPPEGYIQPQGHMPEDLRPRGYEPPQGHEPENYEPPQEYASDVLREEDLLKEAPPEGYAAEELPPEGREPEEVPPEGYASKGHMPLKGLTPGKYIPEPYMPPEELSCSDASAFEVPVTEISPGLESDGEAGKNPVRRAFKVSSMAPSSGGPPAGPERRPGARTERWKGRTNRIPDVKEPPDLGADEVSGKPLAIESLTDEQKKIFSYFIPVRGMEDQLCRALSGITGRIRSGKAAATGNLIIQGGQGSGKTTLATSMIKVLQEEVGHPNEKIGKIQAEALNKKDIGQLLRKVAGGCLIIEQAGELTRQTIVKLSLLLEQDTSGILIILEDTSKGIKKTLAQDEGFARKFTEKITVPIFSNDELVAFARSYSKELGYEIDELAVLALYNRISNIQRLDQATTLTEVKYIVDEAIRREARKGMKKYFSILTASRYTDDDLIVLREKDFN